MLRLTTPRLTNFYYSFVFLPAHKRQAIEAVYAFARRGDDLADEGLAPEEAHRRLERYRAALDRCYDGSARPQPGEPAPEQFGQPHERVGLAALAEAVHRFQIPRQPFEDLILGFEMDLSGTRYGTFEELAVYCYRVASTIGLIAIEIFGYSNPLARQYAVNMGMALQLVNILRDLESDGRAGRIYLPAEDLDRFGVSGDDLLSGHPTSAKTDLVRFECARARDYFDQARFNLPAEDRRSLVSAEIMGAIYWGLLRRIERRGYDPFGRRIRIPRWRKLGMALQVYLGKEWYR